MRALVPSFLLGLLLSLSLVGGGVARAQSAEDLELARHRFATGQILYAQEKYADALVEFEAAKATMKKPEFDYNIGMCLAKLGRAAEAAAALERYMKARPNDPDAATIWEHIAELRADALKTEPKPADTTRPTVVARVEPPHTVTPPTTEPPHTVEPKTGEPEKKQPVTTQPSEALAVPPLGEPAKPGLLSTTRGKAGLGLTVGGGVVVLTAAALGIAALVERSSYDQQCDMHMCDANRDLYDTAHTLAIVTDTLLAVGAVAVITGVVLLVRRGGEPATTAQRGKISLAPSRGGLAVQF